MSLAAVAFGTVPARISGASYCRVATALPLRLALRLYVLLAPVRSSRALSKSARCAVVAAEISTFCARAQPHRTSTSYFGGSHAGEFGIAPRA
eukprot:scaffold103852_cov69-Phaeocystis_antarctica.AAC.3